LGDIGKILSQYQHLIAKGELDQATKLQEKIDQLDAWQYLHKIEMSIFSKSRIAVMSMWLVGSSSSKIFGSCIKAFANITRLRQPPDKVGVILEKYLVNINT
jgi:hypothetical protein